MDDDTQNPKRSSPLKWLGCGCLVVAILAIGGCGAFFFGIFGLLRASDPCQQSFAAAAADREVLAITGEPLELGMVVSGSINYSNDVGQAELSIPVSGPDGGGTIETKASRAGGTWRYESVVFKAEDGTTVTIEVPRPEE